MSSTAEISRSKRRSGLACKDQRAFLSQHTKHTVCCSILLAWCSMLYWVVGIMWFSTGVHRDLAYVGFRLAASTVGGGNGSLEPPSLSALNNRTRHLKTLRKSWVWGLGLRVSGIYDLPINLHCHGPKPESFPRVPSCKAWGFGGRPRPASESQQSHVPHGSEACAKLKETTGGEFRVYRASIRLL